MNEPLANSSTSAVVPVRWEIQATVIRADGMIEELGTIASTGWRRFSLHRLLSSLRIRRVNWRNRHRMKEG